MKDGLVTGATIPTRVTSFVAGSRWYTLIPRADFYWQDQMWGRIFNDPSDSIKAWEVTNAQLTLNAPNNVWYVQGFIKNVFDENDVTGYTGTPVNVNGYLYHYRADVQAAGIQYPRQGQYYVAVDSGHNDFTGASLAGRYLLHAWLNDVSPPLAAMITTTVAAGRPTIVARTLDLQSGVDPLSLVIAYGRVLVGAAAYDPLSGIAIFPLPPTVAALKPGKTPLVFQAGDFQEAMKWMRKALELLGNDANWREKAQARLKLYEQGNTHREN
jgi:hypothetical protein